jgi:hypothetical protein
MSAVARDDAEGRLALDPAPQSLRASAALREQRQSGLNLLPELAHLLGRVRPRRRQAGGTTRVLDGLQLQVLVGGDVTGGVGPGKERPDLVQLLPDRVDVVVSSEAAGERHEVIARHLGQRTRRDHGSQVGEQCTLLTRSLVADPVPGEIFPVKRCDQFCTGQLHTSLLRWR